MKRIFCSTPPALLLLAGFIGAIVLLNGTGCPPPASCAGDAECDDGVFCNGAETCVDGACVAGTEPCSEDETCDEDADSCVPVVFRNPYPDALEYFAHDLAAGGHFGQDCTACHHEEPSSAGQACSQCHDQDEALFDDELAAVVPKLRNVMHAAVLENGKSGCRACHNEETEDGLWDCGQCHLPFNDL